MFATWRFAGIPENVPKEKKREDRKPFQHVAVVVMGDVGHSPRMQYHCISLARAGSCVTLIGLGESQCTAEVESNQMIRKLLLSPFPMSRRKYPFLLWAPLKVLHQTYQLLRALLVDIDRPDAILVQVPPSLPLLFVVFFVSHVRPCRVVVDWHNFGYTILALSKGKSHPFVRFMKLSEAWMGRLIGQYHFCVTDAMRRWLLENWKVKARTLYDRPPHRFRSLSKLERHSFFVKLKQLGIFKRSEKEWGTRAMSLDGEKNDENLFTSCQGKLRKDRPVLLVSSTSWTPDEDFSILLNAMTEFERRRKGKKNKIRIVLVITGKGPEKEMYKKRILEMQRNGLLKDIHIYTPWLEAEDYPKLLGVADLGVCLHTSSSGLDLPMKVVDMYGSGLPVCAVEYNCVRELVKDGVNGMLFDGKNPNQLTDRLIELLDRFPKNISKLDEMRKGVSVFQRVRWQANWDEVASDFFCF
eukprot:g2255.t1